MSTLKVINGVLVNQEGCEVIGIHSTKPTSYLIFYALENNYWDFVTYVTSYN